MAEPTTVALMIIPSLVMGAAIGILELIFVHADEAGMGWIMHGFHAIPATILFTFASMNVDWTLHMLNLHVKAGFWVVMGIRAVIALLAMFKISAAAAIAGRVGEKLGHTIALGIIIFAAPFVWPFIAPMLPKALR